MVPGASKQFSHTNIEGRCFSNLFGATSIALLTDFLSPEEIAARPLEELIDFIMDKGKKHFTDPKLTAQALKDAARKAHRLRGGLLELPLQRLTRFRYHLTQRSPGRKTISWPTFS